MLLKTALFFAPFCSWALAASGVQDAAKKPNIVFIFTDDQDQQMHSLQYMDGVKHHLINQGTQYKHHYCTVALCCPSRVNLWTGKAAHNTNVTDLQPPFGGYPKFIHRGYNDDYLPIWMQKAGYSTYYTGKLMNYHNENNYDKPFAKGFDGSDFLIEPGTYRYLNSTFVRNHEKPVTHPNGYSTDILANKSLAFLDDGVKSGKPFFLTMAPVAPHTDTGPTRPDGLPNFGPIPAERHRHLFSDAKVPRDSGNFNPDKPSGASWLKELHQMSNDSVSKADEFYKLRLQTLQAVDELVNQTIARLEHHGILNNTYIVYSSDNGFHIGQHRLDPGKNCPYEEDVNVPLIIRGPGIESGAIVDMATSHTDLAPTFLQWAQGTGPGDLDGLALPNVDKANATSENWEHVQIEHWGSATFEGSFGDFHPNARNSTYKALRVIGDGYNYYYSVWCDNEHELYDMVKDPGQMTNLYHRASATGASSQPTGTKTGLKPKPTKSKTGSTLSTTKSAGAENSSPLSKREYALDPSGSPSGTPTAGPSTSPAPTATTSATTFPINRLESRLDALLLVLKSCKTKTCREPWGALHPDGKVTSLKQAMDKKYDHFYEQEQNKVSFDKCEMGYFPESEGPQDFMRYAFDPEWSLHA